jgi:hypothetical protein
VFEVIILQSLPSIDGRATRMRKFSVLVLGLVIAGCAPPAADVPRDVYGAAAKGTLPPEVPKDQQVRYSDEIWKKSVAICVNGQNKQSSTRFAPDEANRFCACSMDLMQTRVTAARMVQLGMGAQAGKQPSPRDIPEMLPIVAACWPR